MRLRYLFLIFVGLLSAVWILLLVQSPLHNSTIFYITEAVTLLCLLFLVYFYRKVVKPMNSIANGMELLHEQDFSSKLSSVGQPEADQIVAVFNRMMVRMKDERVRMREQNHFLDLLINASPMGVIILDFEQRITTINPSAKRFLATGEISLGTDCRILTRRLPAKLKKLRMNRPRLCD